MSHMHIMAYDDMFRSDSTTFRSLRAMYLSMYLRISKIFLKKLKNIAFPLLNSGHAKSSECFVLLALPVLLHVRPECT